MPRRLVIRSMPPCKLAASPMAATLTSILDPGCAKGGKVAVTIAAAVLRTNITVGFTLMPIC